MEEENEKWLFEISGKKSYWSINYKEIWQYRDLLLLFVKRDIVTFYKQTVLGPIWFIIQPLLTSVIQFVIFSKIAEIPSDGVPYFLFVLAGNILWFYFSDSMKSTSETFTANQSIFGKVYFPRIIMPFKVILSNLIKFGIQFAFFLVVLLYYFAQGAPLLPNWSVLLLPVLLLVVALIALGFGMIISSLTVKYRDLNFVITFGISLYMYITPIVYPTSLVLEKIDPKYHPLIYMNPLTALFDFFKYAFLGSGSLDLWGLVYSIVFSVVVFFLGLLVFNRTEKSFIDVI
ncbi:ABC transporter permease [Flavobacterium orientale]|uniref:Transport permease protein n=1 Tax=Flavobacterium orientale TaxID=1756020 RepID=A0A917D9D3_9FLAO|nr:ABC transporter permease [Flavobacterium orientale]GGD14902.1 transport permease protein [Flavobacterium orientale]